VAKQKGADDERPQAKTDTYLRFWLILLLSAFLIAAGLCHVTAGSENLGLGVVVVIVIPCLTLVGLIALVMIAVGLARMSLAAAKHRRSR
jgi:uncharacterized membrane protein YgaE (UPF0421/DUF939 family)